ncbi:MAG: DUF4097 domain-containing protein [Lachnospiraceae bacterium]|nr:DUF4097 domain-containing protein [Lachnospiraceae bacterium]MCI7041934.1 DUF4097 domain-containing protein [Lachnospiraceae bacterium]MDD7628860.1 DUF4097 family beta strand repeat-containing protein [Lachnospiraceae bacterium]MDY4120355.1 DUF4097 family beta strand repeat-containing protein [Lachnospiraceae bacterium]
MKKFAKVSLIVAGILFAIGCVLGSISAIAGGRSIVRTIREKEYFGDKMNALADAVGSAVFYVTDGNWGFIRDEEGKTVSTWREDSGQIEAAGVNNMKLQLGAGTFIVEEKEEADGVIDISVAGVGSCNYYVDGKTLHVEGFEGKWHTLNMSNDNRIEIRVPKNSCFEELSIDAGAGIVEISDLEVKELELQGGAGQFLLNDMKIGELKAEIGAGKMEATGINTLDAELSVGVGELLYGGSITGNLDAECGMGNMELTLSGKETDHNYEIECAAGNVDIGSFSVSAMAAEKVINNNAVSNFDIECSMGNITIDFED